MLPHALRPAGLHVQGDAEEVLANLFTHPVGAADGVQGAHAHVSAVTIDVAALEEPVGAPDGEKPVHRLLSVLLGYQRDLDDRAGLGARAAIRRPEGRNKTA